MTRASKFERAALGVLVAAGALAGCGGSSDTTTSASGTNAASSGSGGTKLALVA